MACCSRYRESHRLCDQVIEHSSCTAAMLACSYCGNSVSMACSSVPPSIALVQGINCRGSVGHSSAWPQGWPSLQ